jgi:hypothetical protein
VEVRVLAIQPFTFSIEALSRIGSNLVRRKSVRIPVEFSRFQKWKRARNSTAGTFEDGIQVFSIELLVLESPNASTPKIVLMASFLATPLSV